MAIPETQERNNSADRLGSDLMSDIPHRDKDEKKMTAREAAIEAAAKHIYEAKGDRLGKEYIGWDKEPDEVKADWLLDVRATIDAYESASPAGEEMWNEALEEAAKLVLREWFPGADASAASIRRLKRQSGEG